MQTGIPCVLMRGGTSKGPVFLATDLPADPALRDRVLLAAMGSPDGRQIDGIGGADPLTSKVAIVGPPSRPDADCDYLFAQVSVDCARVDTAPNCGNMLAAAAPHAIEAGLVRATRGRTVVRVHNVNTRSLVEAVVATPGGRVRYEGDCAIDGVPGTASPITLRFLEIAGARTGQLLPAGSATIRVDGVDVSCIDAAVPVVMMRAADFGLTGREQPAALNADTALLTRLEFLRRAAALAMGMGDVAGSVLPKVCLVAPPAGGGTVASRYFVPHRCHAAHAATGALCLAVACRLPGTVAADVARLPVRGDPIVVEHPAGRIEVDAAVALAPAGPSVLHASLVRTARRLFEGRVLVPASVWRGPRVASAPAGARPGRLRPRRSDRPSPDRHGGSGACARA